MVRTPIRIPTPLPNPPTTPNPNPLPQPFPIPPGNKPPTDREDCKEICVWATIPKGNPKKIRYQYPGESAVEIEGESYTIENIPGRVVATYTGTGYVKITGGVYQWINNFTQYARVGDATVYINLIWSPSYVPGGQQPVRGEFLGWEWANDFGSNGNATWNYSLVRLTFRNQNGSIITAFLYPEGAANNYSYGFLQTESRNLESINLIPSNPEQITPDQCQFKVYNTLGQIILDITRAVCPIVTEIPPNCSFEGQNRQLIHTELQPPRVLGRWNYTKEVNGNCVRVKRTFQGTTPLPAFSVTVATVCSPDGCNVPPKVDIECCDDCSDKSCPKGTAQQILIKASNLIQCVDSKGCVIKEASYDPKCHKPNCIC